MAQETPEQIEFREKLEKAPKEIQNAFKKAMEISKIAFSRGRKKEKAQKELILYFKPVSQVSMFHVVLWMNEYHRSPATVNVYRDAWLEFKKYSNNLESLVAQSVLSNDNYIEDDIHTMILKHDQWNSKNALDFLNKKYLSNRIHRKSAEVLIFDIKDLNQLRYLAEKSENPIIQAAARKHQLIEESKWSYVYMISNLKR